MQSIAYKKNKFIVWEEKQIRLRVRNHIYMGHVGNVDKYEELELKRKN